MRTVEFNKLRAPIPYISFTGSLVGTLLRKGNQQRLSISKALRQYIMLLGFFSLKFSTRLFSCMNPRRPCSNFSQSSILPSRVPLLRTTSRAIRTSWRRATSTSGDIRTSWWRATSDANRASWRRTTCIWIRAAWLRTSSLAHCLRLQTSGRGFGFVGFSGYKDITVVSLVSALLGLV